MPKATLYVDLICKSSRVAFPTTYDKCSTPSTTDLAIRQVTVRSVNTMLCIGTSKCSTVAMEVLYDACLIHKHQPIAHGPYLLQKDLSAAQIGLVTYERAVCPCRSLHDSRQAPSTCSGKRKPRGLDCFIIVDHPHFRPSRK